MKWNDILCERDFLIVDGALGTCIESKGDVLDPILWSAGHLITNPSRIQQIHEEYLVAGADIITTSAYQISYEGFQDHLQYKYQYCTSKVDDLLRFSTELARNAIKQRKGSRPKYVAASMGCYGAHLANGSEFFGGYSHLSQKELFNWHLPKLQVLASSQPDLLAFETIPLIEEAKAIVSLLDHLSLDLPSWISVACKSSSILNGGESIEDLCRVIEDMDVGNSYRLQNQLALGVNCTPPEYVGDILLTLKEFCHKDRPLIAYPNRGDFWDETNNTYKEITAWSPSELASKALEWHQYGASILGGCCKTNASYIRAIHDVLIDFHARKA